MGSLREPATVATAPNLIGVRGRLPPSRPGIKEMILFNQPLFRL